MPGPTEPDRSGPGPTDPAPTLPGAGLDLARLDAGLSHAELWLRYFEIGGMRTAVELEAFLYDALQPSAHDHDLIVHALNERRAELHRSDPVAYLGDDDRDRRPSHERSGAGERAGVAPDLHHALVQRLYATGLALHGVLDGLPGQDARETVEAAVADLDAAIRQIRWAAFALPVSSGDHG